MGRPGIEPFLRGELARVIDVLAESQIYGDSLSSWRLVPAHGIPDEEIDASLPAGLQLPVVVRDYYRLLGRHPINNTHNRLRPLDRVELVLGRIVFLDENQAVVMWGIDQADLLAVDPEVWQAVPSEDLGEIRWYSEEKPFTSFIAEMWRWTVTGEGDG